MYYSDLLRHLLLTPNTITKLAIKNVATFSFLLVIDGVATFSKSDYEIALSKIVLTTN